MVPATTKRILCQLLCYLKTQVRISRTIQWRQFTLEDVCGLKHLRRLEQDSDNSTVARPTPNFKNIAGTFDEIESALNAMRGVTDIHLAYVIRRNLQPHPEDEEPSSDFASLDDEMTARAPILPGPEGTEARGPSIPHFWLIRRLCGLPSRQSSRERKLGASAGPITVDARCTTRSTNTTSVLRVSTNS